jgi:hypothetical protein
MGLPLMHPPVSTLQVHQICVRLLFHGYHGSRVNNRGNAFHFSRDCMAMLKRFPYLYNAWQVLRAVVGITCMSKRMDFDVRFCKNHIFRFLILDSISQPHGEGDFPIHYTIDMHVLGSLESLFLFVYKCGYLRALTVYVFGASIVFVVSSSFLFFLLLVVG